MRQFGGDSLLGVLLHRCSFGSRADAERRLALLARSNCHRRGRWQESSHPWDTKENIRWSVQLPGWGTSSPVVYGNRVFVTSEVEDGGKKSLLTLCFVRAPHMDQSHSRSPQERQAGAGRFTGVIMWGCGGIALSFIHIPGSVAHNHFGALLDSHSPLRNSRDFSINSALNLPSGTRCLPLGTTWYRRRWRSGNVTHLCSDRLTRWFTARSAGGGGNEEMHHS